MLNIMSFRVVLIIFVCQQEFNQAHVKCASSLYVWNYAYKLKNSKDKTITITIIDIFITRKRYHKKSTTVSVSLNTSITSNNKKSTVKIYCSPKNLYLPNSLHLG